MVVVDPPMWCTRGIIVRLVWEHSLGVEWIPRSQRTLWIPGHSASLPPMLPRCHHLLERSLVGSSIGKTYFVHFLHPSLVVDVIASTYESSASANPS